MTAARPFDPAEPLPDGRLIIEASAGTGKTFTIAAAVTRLVAEEAIPLEQILVVTFTRAATAELKGRIRQRMVDTVAAIDGTDVNIDEHMAVLVDVDAAARNVYAKRLVTALTRYDRAQIFTIHGFAQRLLRQLGFRSRLSPDIEPGEIDSLLLAQTASDLVVGRFATDPVHVLDPKKVAAIGAAVNSTPDAAIVPDVLAVSGEPKLRVEMAHAMKAELERRLRAFGLMTYDDGLVEARDALTDAHIGDAARALLDARYQVALVDESQDTDPVQWQVIRAVFDDSRLVVIGDPKQSIYAFRGADVESYLAAVDDATATRTLATNWRSDGPLLTALDALFAGATFGDPRIVYHQVRPAQGREGSAITGGGPPLVIHRFGKSTPVARRKDGYFRVGEARQSVAGDVANEIVALLNSGATFEDDDGIRPVGPGDIAVLCRTRNQVELVRVGLSERKVPSVAARTGSVFDTPAAEAWRRFLLAVERPDRTDFVRLAATSLLIGRSLVEVAQLTDVEVLDMQNQIRLWRDTMLERGVPALVTDVDRSTDLASRILGRADGERTITDLIHIAEEMHAVWRRGRIGSLVAWLEAAMEEATKNADSGLEEPESRQRRLETDAAAVQVQTVHAAKGLEYPIVFVPYLWDPPSAPPGADDVPIFHEDAPPEPGQPRRRLIDVGGKDSPDFDLHREAAKVEEAAEESRLLYVSLTRARHLLRVWWIEDHLKVEETKLNDLLIRDGGGVESLVAAAGGTIETVVLDAPVPTTHYLASAASGEELHLAELGRPLDYLWRRVSFSSLSPDDPVSANLETSETPLRSDEAADADPALVASLKLPMADLPRGAAFGSLVHDVLEHVTLDSEDVAGALREVVDERVARGAWDLDPAVLVVGLVAAVETPLGPAADTPTLRDLDPARELKEMVFEFPVRHDGDAVSLHDVARLMLEHLPDDDPYRRYAERLRGLETSRFRGYLTGAIDLTTVLADEAGRDRFVVMDYKSNALPAAGEAPSTADYGHGPLVAAMSEGNYVLQALLYQVALHRYLQWRLPGYDSVLHLGGAMYLFVRGMVGGDTPIVDGARCGVARWTPPAEMIVAISRLFAGGRE